MAVFDDFFRDVLIYALVMKWEKKVQTERKQTQPDSSDDNQTHETKQAKKAGRGELIQVSEANSYKVGPY